MNDAKTLFMQDPKFKKGFKFDHLWVMLKDLPKFTDNVMSEKQSRRRMDAAGNFSSDDDHTTGSAEAVSPNVSQFSINLDDDNSFGSSSQRPMGVKKSKQKKKMDDEIAKEIRKIRESNERLEQRLESVSGNRQRMEFEMQRKQDFKIMSINLDTITDPVSREYFMAEKNKILQRNRAQEVEQQGAQQPGAPNASNDVNQYFANIGSSGSYLPDY